MTIGRNGVYAVRIVAVCLALLSLAWIGLLTIAPSSTWKLDIKWEFSIP